MWWTSLRRWLGRVEIRLATTLLLLASPVLAAALCLSFVYAAHEKLEDRWEQLAALADVIALDLADDAEKPLAGPLYDLLDREEIAIRIREGDRLVSARGPAHWFTRDVRDASRFWDAVRLRSRDVLALRRDVGHARIDMAASLRDFAEERAELMTGFWISLFAGLAGSAFFVIVATGRALRPLRDATDAVRRVNASHLETRLAVRGTDDLVDRHAGALNQALGRIEEGFARTRAFGANVAHELRTPINRLLNQSGARLLGTQDVDSLTRALLSVQHTAEEMEAIVEGLLLLAQADEGRLRVHMSELALADLLEGLRELYEPACEDLGVRLEIKSADVTIVADETLLVRALSNLIDNALGCADKGGRIWVDATSDGGSVSISVCDAGPGIDTQDLERIFDRFFRVDPTGRRRGAGLGLPIARAIAVAHGGGLSARSAPGAGTCFDLELPRKAVGYAVFTQFVEPRYGPKAMDGER